MAGILSLLNDVRLEKGLPSLGYVVPRLWQVAQEHPGEAFVDLATASNTSCGCGKCGLISVKAVARGRPRMAAQRGSVPWRRR